jgi:hypothetical protein
VQGLPSSTSNGVPAAQAPDPLQVSCPSQTVPLSHAVPEDTGVWLTPAIALQASVVQELPSSTVGGVPAVQTPEPLQVS